MKVKRSILIVDDNFDFGTALAGLLIQQGYSSSAVTSLKEAQLKLPNLAPPSFILLDHELKETIIDAHSLVELKAQDPEAIIVIYTRASMLSDAQSNALLDAGARRVINKQDADVMVDNITVLTNELEELTDLAHTLAGAVRERQKLAAALAGTGVGVTLIDRQYNCWFENQQHAQIAGSTENDLCWRKFHDRRLSQGRCWGCNVPSVLDLGDARERVFLARYREGRAKWVSVRSTPIFDSTGRVIAVREATVELGRRALLGYAPEDRLAFVAQGLIHKGFGRARIHELVGETETRLRAAAAWSDSSEDAKGYMRSLEPLPLDYSEDPYVTAAVQKQRGLVVRGWDLGKCPWQESLGLELPYLIVPVWAQDEKSLVSIICLDFVGMSESMRASCEELLAVDESLTWLKEEYGREVRDALRPEGPHGAYRVIHDARMEIGAARSVDEALTALRTALANLLPELAVSVRILTGEERSVLRRYELLCIGQAPRGTEASIGLYDTTALAAYVLRARRFPLWIEDYAGYVRSLRDAGSCRGYEDITIASAAIIPLTLEGTRFGTLSLYSSNQVVDWERYKKPIADLAQWLVLVLRDVLLHEELEAANSEKASMIAYSLSTSTEAIWKHWALQRLAEATMLVDDCREELKELDAETNRAEGFLLDVSDAIGMIAHGYPEKDQAASCLTSDVLEKLARRYSSGQVAVSVEDPGEPVRGAMPCYLLQHILGILIDNAVEAIETSRQGSEVKLLCSATDDEISIEVADDGPGIPIDRRSLLFKGPVPSTKGKGVGLLFAKGAARHFGGDLIWCPTGAGSKFLVRLPIAAPSEG